MKKILLLLTSQLILAMLIVGGVFGQQKIFNEVSNNQLTSTQQAKLNAWMDMGVYTDFQIIEANPAAILDSNGYVLLHSAFMNIDSVLIKAMKVEYATIDDFTWYGKYSNGSDSINQLDEVFIDFIMIKKFGQIAAVVGKIDESFNIVDLTGGKQAILKYNQAPDFFKPCGTLNSTKPVMGDGSPNCGPDSLRVLILYPDYLKDRLDTISIYLQGVIALAITQGIYANSGMHTKLVLANVQSDASITAIDKFETTIDNYKASIPASIVAKRTLHRADLVMIMSAKLLTFEDSGYDGMAMEIGPDADNYIAWVKFEILNNGKNTFAHELSHLLGARHHIDIDLARPIQYDHAYVFNVGFLGLSKRSTLLASLAKNRIWHVSSPLIKYEGKYTGNYTQANNARRIDEVSPIVSRNIPDPILLSANLNITDMAKCENTFTASVEILCGAPPYTYQWASSNNGIEWALGFPGSSASQNFTIPVVYPVSTPGVPGDPGALGSKFVSVIVTDALGRTVVKNITAVNYCPRYLPVLPLSGNIPAAYALKVYPNPNSGHFFVEMNNLDKDYTTDVVLTNINGTTVYTQKHFIKEGNNLLEINQTIPPGVYVLSFMLNYKMESFQITIL